MIVLIDNYDSFTYNLYQEIGELYGEVKVFRNDENHSWRNRTDGSGSDRYFTGTGIPGLRRDIRERGADVQRQDADSRRVPRTPGDRGSVRRENRTRRQADARQGQQHCT